MAKHELPSNIDFPDETKQWFDDWVKSERTKNWDAAQWQYFYDTALVHASVWGSGDMAMLGELRTRLAYLGLTFDEKPKVQNRGETVLSVIQGNRANRAAKAAN